MLNTSKIAEYAFFYIFIGSISVMCNTTVMIVQLKNRQSLSNSLLIMILAFGDIVFCCGLVSSGLIRSSISYNHDLNSTSKIISAGSCLVKFPWMWLFGSRIQTLSILIIAFDRFLAIKYYVWYFNNQASNVKRHVTCGLVIFSFAVCSLTCMIFTTDLTKPISPLCFPSEIFNVYQASYHYCLNAIVGFLSSIVIFSSISAFVKIRRKNSVSPINIQPGSTVSSNHNGNNSWGKDFHLTLSMLIIGLMEIFLVVVPNLLLATLAYQFYEEKSSILKVINFSAGLLIGLRSMMSLPVHLAVNKDFRHDFFKCVGLQHSA